ncbi:protein-serine/threonine phosphatase [Malassezia vespertilionis]|uniref:Protein phosphatase n=1 Tax=Malassezia vespertilionis TaxID=2020962 RepID=A0A2N1J8Y4_9BASI|nr:protein-serine/threonine phosphatase [Malassezia vespertilionis]PKI83021.1 hypothetical protein MVES_002995 [Malassezia vespertilionis]WFD07785.1 protein-serine/threonine phosphatase [Malassezia vespertilionis]
MIRSTRPWRPGCAAADTFKRFVVPNAPARAVVPVKRPFTATAHKLGAESLMSQIVTAYAFAAKPRETPEQSGEDKNVPLEKELIGKIDPESELGKWRADLLEGGDAGEDALMISKSSSCESVMMGVADGVGGWTESGIDPSHFSNALLYYATQYVEKQASFPSPKAVLEHAFARVTQDALVTAGSSTVCLLTLDALKGKLYSANIGDSGYVHLRPNEEPEGRLEVVGQSPAQLYGFNTPYQLAKVPEEMRGPGSLSNTPQDALVEEEELKAGDMVLVMTDGFLDNVHCKLPPKEALTHDAPQRPELLQLLDMLQDKHREHWATRKHPSTVLEEKQDFTNIVASTLMQYARLCQSTEEKVSPFQLDAARYGIYYPGGKVDDIALVCATVV